jgi:hypothetical protein
MLFIWAFLENFSRGGNTLVSLECTSIPCSNIKLPPGQPILYIKDGLARKRQAVLFLGECLLMA